MQPYFFALKEGLEIKNDLFDYSLIMLQVNCREIVKSPAQAKAKFKRQTAKFEAEGGLSKGANETMQKADSTGANISESLPF